MRLTRSLFVLALLLGPALARAQQMRPDTLRGSGGGPGVRAPSVPTNLALPLPAELRAFGLLAPRTPAAFLVADSAVAALGDTLRAQRAVLWAGSVRATVPGAAELPPSTPAEAATAPATALFGQSANLTFLIRSRIETKFERDRNLRCLATDFLDPTSGCRGTFQPQFNFQFAMKTTGTVADRLHVNVDYDSQREFDASNNIGVYYEGKPDEIIHRVEVGNVTFAPPPSRFITAGIPEGNYGIQAIGQLGPMTFRAIAAQQRGNVVRDRVFTVGDRTEQAVTREIDDYQLERRRFFWVIDPRKYFPTRYPNIDILDPSLPALAAQIPPGERPRRVLVYRYRSPSAGGSVARDINGPFAFTRYARNTNVIGPYEVLQQGVDYYIDPTNLWICLVTPLGRDERLAVSYTVTGPDGREAAIGSVGGTFPQRRGITGKDTVNLLWDNQVLPGDSAFDREIRSAYRIGGEDLQRSSLSLKVVVGSGTDQERPVGGAVDTYLQLLGLAQRTNASAFDAENRLWPRVGDPNEALSITGGMAGTSTKLIRDYFVIFPSLMPFSDSGLVRPPNPANDSLYRTTDEDLVSSLRPPTQYRILASYESQGSGQSGTLMLGSVQVRPNSERIFLDGRQLARGVDYTVNYDIGQVTFNRPDTLFAHPRQVSVQFEENPLFAAAPTSILGFAAQFPTEHGALALTAISQSQQTQFNRPPLGFEAQASLLAGVSGNFTWASPFLTSLLDRLPIVETSAPSSVNVQGELATSRPRAAGGGQAYLETFEGTGGLDVSLQESNWRYGSQPAIAGGGVTLDGIPYDFPLDSASTMAWQNLGTVTDQLTNSGGALQVFPQQIDSSFVYIGGQAFQAPETVLWLDLYPPNVGGLADPSDGHYRWHLPEGGGRPWRSISQNLSPTGLDLSQVEALQFWALVDTSTVARAGEPSLVFDFGEVSENSIYFAPDTLTTRFVSGAVDTSYTGRRLQGFDRLNTERDSITQSFDVARNDIGLPGDRVDSLVLQNLITGQTGMLRDFDVCRRSAQPVLPLGDATADCTVGNRRLDENDLDRDGFLNFHANQRNAEQLVRFVVDLGNPASYSKIGRCYRSLTDTSSTGSGARPVCWVKVQIPFAAPSQVLNAPILRRIKSMRITMVGGPGRGATAFTQLALARMRLTGAPWTKRTPSAIAGVGGTNADAGGAVIATTIGTQDRDSQGGLFYQSPPGVTDQPDSKGSVYSPGTIQVNEQSMRLVAVDVPLYHRAEAFYRFPEGTKNFMGYRQLRVWARGRGKGWGPNGDLQFYIKMGRDADNFYLYRTPVNAGSTADAWLPEVSVDFARFIALRAQLENAYLRGGPQMACHGADSALVMSSQLPLTPGAARWAACDSGYIVYTTDPAVEAPNLAAVQELAVGILRTSDAGLGTGGPIAPTDSLELWVDDIRLTNMLTDPGYAGQIGLSVKAADIGTFQLSASRRDQNFHQLGEQPSFVADDQLDLASTLHLDRFLPRALGLAIPMSVHWARTGGAPTFLSSSDLAASAIPGARTPTSSTTEWDVALRRAAPLEHSIWAPLVNNLSLQATYVRAASRSEFQTGRATAFTSGLDYTLVSQPRGVRAPGWLRRLIDRLPPWLRDMELVRSLRDASLRWNPSLIHVSSSYAKNADQRASYLLPVAFAGDTARRVSGLENVWRNTAAMELRPFSTLSARVDVSSLRDLKNYGDSTPVGIIAGGERERFLGLDMGLERERQVTSSLSAAPPLTAWLRPRFDFSSTFALLRDPNTGTLIQAADTTGPFRIPRRLYNTQSLAVTTSIDIPRALTLYSGDSSPVRILARALSAVDVQWRRDLRSTFDGVGFDPSLGYQLGLGGVSAFREVNGVPATSAGVARNLIVAHSVYLPGGVTILDRYSSVSSTSWSRVLDVQTLLEARQQTFPDVSVRWSFVPPAVLRVLLTAVTAQAGARVTTGRTFQPTAGDQTFIPGSGLRIDQRLTQFPVSGSITWSALGGFSTDASWNSAQRREVRSGGLMEGSQTDVSVDIAKAFPLPRRWTLKSNLLRTRLGFQETHAQAFFIQDTLRSRITDNGRWAVTANADSDVSDTMSLSFLLARVITFDNALDRRFSQTVASVVFHLQFAAGATP